MQIRDVFEAFRQLDQSHTREFAGTGLGLSITKKLLDLLDGSIDVHSTEGRGSCFAIHLPPHAAAPERDSKTDGAKVGAARAVGAMPPRP